VCFFVIESNPRLTLGTFPHSVQVGSIWGATFKVADDHVVCSGGGEHYFTVGAGAGKFGVALTDFFVFISELACVMCLLSFAFGELPWEGDTTTATAGDRRRGGPRHFAERFMAR